MSALTELKRTLVPGAEVYVENHYIDRADHPCFGTKRRTVTEANTSAAHFDIGGRLAWPKAANVTVDDGVFEITGHPKPGDRFLTIVPVLFCENADCGNELDFDSIQAGDGLCSTCAEDAYPIPADLSVGVPFTEDDD